MTLTAPLKYKLDYYYYYYYWWHVSEETETDLWRNNDKFQRM